MDLALTGGTCLIEVLGSLMELPHLNCKIFSIESFSIFVSVYVFIKILIILFTSYLSLPPVNTLIMIRRMVELRTSPSEESVPVPLVNPVTHLTASTVPLYPGAYLIQVQLEGGEENERYEFVFYR